LDGRVAIACLLTWRDAVVAGVCVAIGAVVWLPAGGGTVWLATLAAVILGVAVFWRADPCKT